MGELGFPSPNRLVPDFVPTPDLLSSTRTNLELADKPRHVNGLATTLAVLLDVRKSLIWHSGMTSNQ